MDTDSFVVGEWYQVEGEKMTFDVDEGPWKTITFPKGTVIYGWLTEIKVEDGRQTLYLSLCDKIPSTTSPSSWGFDQDDIRAALPPTQDYYTSRRMQRSEIKENNRCAQEHLDKNEVPDAIICLRRALAQAWYMAWRYDCPDPYGHQSVYAQLVELERAFRKTDIREGSISVLEALVFACDQRRERWRPNRVDVAEEEGLWLVRLGYQYVSTQQDDKAAQTARKLVEIGKLVKKRYASKVFMLLSAAEVLLYVGFSQEARHLIAQADKFFHQQLVTYLDWGGDHQGINISNLDYQGINISNLKEKLDRLKREIDNAGDDDGDELPRNVFFMIAGDTPDDLNTVIDALQNALGDTVRVTRGIQGAYGVSRRSKLRYTARLKITV